MIKRKNIYQVPLVMALLSGFVIAGCGNDKKHTDRRSKDAAAVVPFNPEEHYIVRGRWEIPISNGDSDTIKQLSGLSFFGTAKNSTPMTASVAAAVTFTVDGANFIAPQNPENSASYGTLDITSLRDNSLRQCGVGGTSRCTTGAIRVYTVGTAGSGLWNELEQYGLPISSGTNTVGLDATAAFVAATANIGQTNVLMLRHFNVGTKLQIPISVDFSDAASVSYATTIVVEYVIQ
jgi:hypothetical protein